MSRIPCFNSTCSWASAHNRSVVTNKRCSKRVMASSTGYGFVVEEKELESNRKAGKPWSEKVTPWDFGHELLEPDIDRIARNDFI